MDSGDRVTLSSETTLLTIYIEKRTVIMMLGFILKCKDGESRAQIRDNVVIYLLECYGHYFDNN